MSLGPALIIYGLHIFKDYSVMKGPIDVILKP